MSIAEIKEKLQEAFNTENWNIISEIIQELELELDYISPFDDRNTEWDE